MTTRDLEQRLEDVESELEAVKLTLLDVMNGSRIVAVSERPDPELERELHGSAAWSSGRDEEDVPLPAGAIIANNPSRCLVCNAAIRPGELITKAPDDAEPLIASRWVHSECAP